MKKLYIHGEYMCILNLIALPCLVMFYTSNPMIFWVLLVFLDIANFILLDMESFIQCILRAEYRNEFHHGILRLIVYGVAYMVCLIYIGWTRSLLLFAILLGNKLLESGCNVFIHKFLHHQESNKPK